MDFIYYMFRNHNNTDLPPGHIRFMVDNSNGLDRDSLIYVPKSYNESKLFVPLVIVLHGAMGTAKYCHHEMGWSEKADNDNFIVAYPNGSRPDPSKPPSLRKNRQTWNDGSGRFPSGDAGVNDVEFLKQLIFQLKERYRIDQKRIYICGISNGASMAMKCALELPGQIAAVASCAGALWSIKDGEAMNIARGLSILYINGEKDTMNPLGGGHPKLFFSKRSLSLPKPPVSQIIQAFVKEFGCSKANTSKWLNIENTSHAEVYQNGRDGAEVVLLVLKNHGHHWPGGKSIIPTFVLGPNNVHFDGTNVIWDFFKSHPAPCDR